MAFCVPLGAPALCGSLHLPGQLVNPGTVVPKLRDLGRYSHLRSVSEMEMNS